MNLQGSGGCSLVTLVKGKNSLYVAPFDFTQRRSDAMATISGRNTKPELLGVTGSGEITLKSRPTLLDCSRHLFPCRQYNKTSFWVSVNQTFDQLQLLDKHQRYTIGPA